MKEKEEIAYYKNLFRMLDKKKEGEVEHYGQPLLLTQILSHVFVILCQSRYRHERVHMFALFNVGAILCDDLRQILHEFAKRANLTDDDIDAMIDDIDEDGNGKISFDGTAYK